VATATRPQTDALGPSTIARLNLKLIPFLMLLYLVAYIDRANISVAALRMNADLGLTTRMYGIAVGLFYVTYVLLEVPSNLILSRVGARRWIARIMVSWGIVAAGMCLVQSASQLYVMHCSYFALSRNNWRARPHWCQSPVHFWTDRRLAHL
jgi:sugar phosphate permease